MSTTKDFPTLDQPLLNSTSRLVLSQCTGFVGSTHPYPRAVGPGQPPPGWEPVDSTIPTSYVLIGGYECNRVSIGPYERGPVRIVWDAHDHADIPAKCLEGRPPLSLAPILNAVLANDQQIADHLRNEYGLPVEYAEINATAQPTGPMNERSWTWGPGSTPSELTFVDDGTSAPFDFNERFLWQRRNGIGVLDMTYERTGPELTDREGYGVMQTPMLLANSTTQLFAGPINYFPTLSGEGAFHLFSDLMCEQPAPA